MSRVGDTVFVLDLTFGNENVFYKGKDVVYIIQSKWCSDHELYWIIDTVFRFPTIHINETLSYDA